MSKQKPWYVERRAQLLAELELTRRPEVRLTADAEGGLDFLGRLESPAHLFGVEVKGVLNTQLLDTEGRLMSPYSRELLQQARAYPFPVFVLIFQVKTDEAYFGWLLKPNAAAGPSALKPVEDLVLTPATSATVDGALDEIKRWYGSRVLQAA
jgi:hypothetical protein